MPSDIWIPVVVFGSLGVMIYADPQRPGQTCLRRLRSLHPLECWWVRLCALSRGSAWRAPIPHTNLTIYNTAGRETRPECRASTWWMHLADGSCSGIFHFSCSACSGEGEAGRGRLLSASAESRSRRCSCADAADGRECCLLIARRLHDLLNQLLHGVAAAFGGNHYAGVEGSVPCRRCSGSR